MSDKKQTAVQWLLEQWPILESQLPSSIIDEALQMEREQIETAYQAGDGDAYNLEETKTWAEQYYNETYGGQDESNH
jgi:hypothetical protein